MSENPIPYGYCQCGCGQRTTIAKQSRRGVVAGQPNHFAVGHSPRKRAPLSVRFWGYVSPGTPNECWIWQGYKNRKGYGYLSYAVGNSAKFAHRISWELHYGSIPNGMYVCHRCDVRDCVNPHHLFLGTIADNQTDMKDKNRGRGPSKLTSEHVRTIRDLYAQGGTTQAELGQQFGVARTAISRIVRRIHWKHVR